MQSSAQTDSGALKIFLCARNSPGVFLINTVHVEAPVEPLFIKFRHFP